MGRKKKSGVYNMDDLISDKLGKRDIEKIQNVVNSIVNKVTNLSRVDPEFEVRMKKIEAIKFAMEVIAKI